MAAQIWTQMPIQMLKRTWTPMHTLDHWFRRHCLLHRQHRGDWCCTRAGYRCEDGGENEGEHATRQQRRQWHKRSQREEEVPVGSCIRIACSTIQSSPSLHAPPLLPHPPHSPHPHPHHLPALPASAPDPSPPCASVAALACRGRTRSIRTTPLCSAATSACASSQRGS